jgi:hypothetical protein
MLSNIRTLQAFLFILFMDLMLQMYKWTELIQDRLQWQASMVTVSVWDV